MRNSMRKAEKMMLFMLMGVMAAGCHADVSSNDSTGALQQSDEGTDMHGQENADINVYSLSGSELVPVQTDQDVLSSEEAHPYTAYTDGTYFYYFDKDTSAFRYLVSEKEDFKTAQAEERTLTEKAESYIEKIGIDNIFSADDWKVSELSEGVYSVDLHQKLYDEDVVVASFKFIGEMIYGINLETDVMAFEKSGVKLLDKETAVKNAEQLLTKDYGDSYQKYCSNENLKVETTVTLNAHGGTLYWYMTVENGSYGGYVVEIDAVTGECSYIYQIK